MMVLRELCYSDHAIARELVGSNEGIKLLFSMAMFKEVFDCAMTALEEALALRKSVFDLTELVDLPTLVQRCSVTQFSMLCRILVNCVQEPEPLGQARPATLRSLLVATQKSCASVSIVERNQEYLAAIPGFFARIIRLLAVQPIDLGDTLQATSLQTIRELGTMQSNSDYLAEIWQVFSAVRQGSPLVNFLPALNRIMPYTLEEDWNLLPCHLSGLPRASLFLNKVDFQRAIAHVNDVPHQAIRPHPSRAGKAAASGGGGGGGAGITAGTVASPASPSSRAGDIWKPEEVGSTPPVRKPGRVAVQHGTQASRVRSASASDAAGVECTVRPSTTPLEKLRAHMLNSARVELLFMLSSFLSGKRRVFLHEVLRDNHLLEAFQLQIRKGDWALRKPTTNHIHGPDCECDAHTSDKIQLLRAIHAYIDRNGLGDAPKWQTRLTCMTPVERCALRLRSDGDFNPQLDPTHDGDADAIEAATQQFLDMLPAVLSDLQNGSGDGSDEAAADADEGVLRANDWRFGYWDGRIVKPAADTLWRDDTGRVGIFRALLRLLLWSHRKTPFRFWLFSCVETFLRAAPVRVRRMVCREGLLHWLLELIVETPLLAVTAPPKAAAPGKMFAPAVNPLPDATDTPTLDGIPASERARAAKEVADKKDAATVASPKGQSAAGPAVPTPASAPAPVATPAVDDEDDEAPPLSEVDVPLGRRVAGGPAGRVPSETSDDYDDDHSDDDDLDDDLDDDEFDDFDHDGYDDMGADMMPPMMGLDEMTPEMQSALQSGLMELAMQGNGLGGGAMIDTILGVLAQHGPPPPPAPATAAPAPAPASQPSAPAPAPGLSAAAASEDAAATPATAGGGGGPADEPNRLIPDEEVSEPEEEERYKLQSAFDVLGEVCKLNVSALAAISNLRDELFEKLVTIICTRLLDSNVFLRIVLVTATAERRTPGTIADVPHPLRRALDGDLQLTFDTIRVPGLSVLDTKLYRWIMERQIPLLHRLIHTVDPADINQENICCINTAIHFLVAQYEIPAPSRTGKVRNPANELPPLRAHVRSILDQLCAYDVERDGYASLPVRQRSPEQRARAMLDYKKNPLMKERDPLVSENEQNRTRAISARNLAQLCGAWKKYYGMRGRDRHGLYTTTLTSYDMWDAIATTVQTYVKELDADSAVESNATSST